VSTDREADPALWLNRSDGEQESQRERDDVTAERSGCVGAGLAEQLGRKLIRSAETDLTGSMTTCRGGIDRAI
jgi:hypothetical protein